MWSKVMSSSSSPIKSKFIRTSSASSDQLLLAMAKNPSISRSPLNVDDEYNKTLRTKSFIDMWAKVHHELQQPVSPPAVSPSPKNDGQHGSGSRNVSIEEGNNTARASRYNADRFPEFLLDPSQDSLLGATAEASDAGCCCWWSHRRVRSLLVEYFNTTFEACTACADLLVSIDRARAHYRSIRLVLIKLRDRDRFYDHDYFDELSCYIEQDNPLSPKNLCQFSDVQSCYDLLMDQLTVAHRRVLRRLRLIRVGKKASGIMLVGNCSVAVVLALLIAVDTIAGLGVIMAGAAGAGSKTGGRRRPRRRRWTSWAGGGEGGMKKLVARVDAAAKGAYIMGKDLETMSRMVRRAHDEVEHERDVARMVLRSRERQLVKEVAREVEGGAAAVAEQLQELEQHVHLCLITINRSRRLVAEEMAAAATGDVAASPVSVA